MTRKLLLFAALAYASLALPALAQAPSSSLKLELTNIQMLPSGDGFFHGYANVTLDRGTQQQSTTFSLDFGKVRSSEDIQQQLPDRVRALAKELEQAADHFGDNR